MSAQPQRSWFEELFRAIDTATWTDLPRFFHADVVYERPAIRRSRASTRCSISTAPPASSPKANTSWKAACATTTKPFAGATSAVCPRPARHWPSASPMPMSWTAA